MKVDLSQQEDDGMGNTALEEDHLFQHKPMLESHGDMHQQMRADPSPMIAPPMQEMNQMEIQFNTPAQQAAVLQE